MRPSRKTTPRSHSLRTYSEFQNQTNPMKAAIARPYSEKSILPPYTTPHGAQTTLWRTPSRARCRAHVLYMKNLFTCPLQSVRPERRGESDLQNQSRARACLAESARVQRRATIPRSTAPSPEKFHHPRTLRAEQ